jgi:hypothetical protein
MTNPFTYFRDNFGKVPEPRPPIIPGPWRIPFFIAVSIASLVALVLLVMYVILPGIQVQQQAAPAPVVAPSK